MSEDGSAAGGRYEEALSVKGATTKATRERQRRIRLNDSFTELAKALDPGKTPKTDKASIVADAIRVVNQLRTENGQLQQLNKFLEERVSSHEKARSDHMMRQAMYQGLNQQPSYQMPAPPPPPQMLPGGVVMGQPVQGVPMQQQQVSQQPPTQAIPVAAPAPGAQAPAQAGSSHGGGKEGGLARGPGGVAAVTGFPHPPSAMGQLSELLHAENGIFDWALDDGSPPEHAWLHLEGGPPDTTQDSLKRPPAA